MVDCGDSAAGWLSSVVSVENVRLVRHQWSDVMTSSCLRSQQSVDDTRLISDMKPGNDDVAQFLV